MALRVIPGLLYGKGNACALPMSGLGNESAVKEFSRSDLANYHQEWFTPNNATLLVVGDTALAEMKLLLEKAFGGWKAGEVPKKVLVDVQQPAKTAVYLMDRPGVLQTTIYGVQMAVPRNSPDALPLQVVNGRASWCGSGGRHDQGRSRRARAERWRGAQDRCGWEHQPVRRLEERCTLACAPHS